MRARAGPRAGVRPRWRSLRPTGPNINANMYCICLSKHEICAHADAVQTGTDLR